MIFQQTHLRAPERNLDTADRSGDILFHILERSWNSRASRPIVHA
jgi:hypothetical protein